MSATALMLPGLEGVGLWQVRNRLDPAANALADRHYSRRRPGSGQIGPPGRKLVLVTPCERAVWLTHWPYAHLAMDGLDAWRCSIFRNEGAGLSSDLIRAAMELTERLWIGRPTDGWVTWIDTRKVRRKRDPGRCYLKAGWYVDRSWSHPYLVRLRADIEQVPGRAATEVASSRHDATRAGSSRAGSAPGTAARPASTTIQGGSS